MPKIVIPLTDTKIKTIKTDSAKVQKLADGNGLFLIITKTGDKSWRFDYSRPYTKKRNSLSFGSYPTVSLADARIRREEARTLLSQNIDPHVEKVRIENEILIRIIILSKIFQMSGWQSKTLLNQRLKGNNAY